LVRKQNEDALFATSRLLAVADGVGGHAAGEVASRIVIDQLAATEKTHLNTELSVALETAVKAGNQTIAFVTACRPQTAGMATTLTAVAVDRDAYTLAHIGDSRAYLLRDGALMLLTRDDSYIQDLIDAKLLDPEAARVHPQRSAVMRVIDGNPHRSAAVVRRAARPGDRVLLCSDGLSDFVEADEIQTLLTRRSLQGAADGLVELALDAGGRDNVTVVVGDVIRTDVPSIWA
jgi:PPM family protein phosphatase